MAFGRLLTAMVTPFNADLTINYSAVTQLVNHLIENGNDGIVVGGTTGESPNLSQEEKVALFKTTKTIVGDRGYVIAGTGSNSTQATIELTQLAESVGVDGVMLVVPYYNKPTQEGMYQHFKAVAESTNLPILLYNVPGRTSANLLPETVARLSKIPNIVAIKEASGNLEQVTQIRTLVDADFYIYSGDDALTLPTLSVGGNGIISVAGHIIGNEIKEMINNYLTGNVEQATKLHLQYYNFCKTMFITTNPVPVKTALNLVGIDVGSVRLPLVNGTETETNQIKDALIAIKKV